MVTMVKKYVSFDGKLLSNGRVEEEEKKGEEEKEEEEEKEKED